MSDLIAETFALLDPSLSSALVTPAAAKRLRRASRWLAPIPRIGLECRLQPGARQVDLQQAVMCDDANEPGRFAAHLRALIDHAEAPLAPAWHRLTTLAEAWDNEPFLRACIRELWLEFDLPDEGVAPSAPSLFVGFRESAATPEPQHALARVLECLWDRPVPARLWENVCQCFDVRPAGAFLSHVGIMLSRPVDALRVELKGVPLDHIVPYLQAVGWSGEGKELERVAAWLFEYVDAVMIGFDVGEEVLPAVGLECFPKSQYGHDRWSAFLDALVARGLCTADRRDGLLDWPGRITPLTAPACWPDQLLIEALRQPADCFGVFERRVNHIKVSYRTGLPLQAKAYLGFGHRWLEVDREETPDTTDMIPTVGPPADRSVVVTEETLARAIRKAVSFLVSARSQNGWWMDFERIGEQSDEWTTAAVGLALAEAPVPAEQAVRQAWTALAGRRPQGGWAWNILFDPDADCTTWGLLFAHAINEHESERAQRAVRALARHLQPDGSVVTFVGADLMRTLTGYPDLDGWCGVHNCVAASVAILPDFRQAVCPYLHRVQRPNGSWKGYWWADDEYATTQAVDALVRRGTPGDRQRIAQAAQWASERLGRDGATLANGRTGTSAFATALLVRLLVLAGDPNDVATAGAAWLLEQQRADGSWTPSARLRVPPPDVLDHEDDPSGTAFYLDHEALFTTACALRALTVMHTNFDVRTASREL